MAICKHCLNLQIGVQIQNTAGHQEPNHLVGHIGSLVETKLTYFPLSSNMDPTRAYQGCFYRNIEQQGWDGIGLYFLPRNWDIGNNTFNKNHLYNFIY